MKATWVKNLGMTASALIVVALIVLFSRDALDKPRQVPTVNIANSNSPVRVVSDMDCVLLILQDGSLWCWGQPVSQGPRAPVPRRIGTDNDWVQASVGALHCLGLKRDGTLWEWGWRMGLKPSELPARVGCDSNWVSVAASGAYAIAVKSDGTLWAWGSGSGLTLGTPGKDQPTPTQVGTDTDWLSVPCQQTAANLALKRDGTLWLWGRLHYLPGQPVVDEPTQVCRERDWVSFPDGNRGWVLNDKGELWWPIFGDPDRNRAASEVLSPIGTNQVPGHFAAGYCKGNYLFEIRADGSLWRAVETYSRAGQFILITGRKWQRVGGRSDWVGIWGTGTVVGLTADGTLWTWGFDPGVEPQVRFVSNLKLLRNKILVELGLPPPRTQAIAVPSFVKEPRRLMRLKGRH